MKRPSLLFPACALGLLAIAAPRAHAGQWVVDHYERNGEFECQVQLLCYPAQTTMPMETKTGTDIYQITWTGTEERAFKNGIDVTSPREPARASIGLTRGASAFLSNPNVPQLPGSFPGTAKGNMTVVVVLRWQRQTISDPVTHESVPDAADNAPKWAWIMEDISVAGGESTSGIKWYDAATNTNHDYDEQHPFAQSQFTFSNIVHPLGLAYTGTKPNGNWQSGSFTLRDRRISCIKADGEQARGLLRKFNMQVDLPGVVALYDYGSTFRNTLAASSTIDYKVTPVSFATLARLKVDHVPADLTTGYAASSGIAAGHIVNDQHLHEADVVLQAHGPEDESVGSVKMPYLPRIEVVNQHGVEKHISLANSDAPKLDHTDQNGRIALGKLTARDLVTDSQTSITVRPKHATGSGAGVGESWASVEWKMGETGDRDWGNFIGGDETGYTDWAWTKLRGVTGKPLIGHHLRFLVNRLIVEVTDPNTQETRIKFFTRDSVEAQAHANDANTDVVCQDDLAGVTSAYVSAPPSGTSDEQGVFKGQFTIKHSDTFIVTSFGLHIQDQDVYVK